jgi:hypothetical protein
MNILSAIKTEEIYRFDLKSCEDISKYLGIWEKLSEKEKEEIIFIDKPLFEKKFDNLSKEEIKLNINKSEFWEEYNDKFVYGEISKSGVKKLANYLKEFTGNFYDIGSGNGKLLLHLSLITNFDKYIGVEIVELRHKYALKINESIQQDVEFICADVLSIDISDANFIFLDDLMFPEDLRIKIIHKIPKNCFYISVYKNYIDEFIQNLTISVTWLEKEMDFYLYKKR